MSYYRVIPRDLFNESKLLKCLGQLALIIHHGVRWPIVLDIPRPESGFIIEQDESSGFLSCANLHLMHTKKDREILLSCSYNSKDSPYPLVYTTWDDDEGQVFNDDGTLSEEFTNYLDQLDAAA